MSTLPMFDAQRRTPVSEQKLTAILAIFDQILFTQGGEAAQIIAQMRGRRGRSQELTWGELEGLADEAKIQAAALAIGIEDLGAGPPVDLARVLKEIAHPDIPICEECYRYAVSDKGGVTRLLTEGRCPICEKGLITAIKQPKPSMAWTTLQEVAPGVGHDRSTISHLAIPLTNELILAGVEGWYHVNPMVIEACEAEGLMDEDERPNVAHLCAFLAHGPMRTNFTRIDQVLVALQTPANIGTYDLISIRAIVREAKSWTPGAARASSAAPTTVVGRPAKKVYTGTPHSQLSDLLADLFDVEEMKNFVLRNFGREVSNGVPWDRSNTTSASNLVSAFERRGIIDRSFFEALVSTVPGQAESILAVARVWGCAPVEVTEAMLDALVQALIRNFQVSEARRAFSRLDGVDHLEQHIAGESPLEKMSSLVRTLQNWGKIDQEFFNEWRSERPRNSDTIDRHAKAFGCR